MNPEILKKTIELIIEKTIHNYQPLNCLLPKDLELILSCYLQVIKEQEVEDLYKTYL